MTYHVAGDWGTSRLRLFRIEGGTVVDRRDGPGIASLAGAPEAILREAVSPWLADGAPASIRLAGMVGSRNGWVEVPYAECPADVAAWRAKAASVTLDGMPVTIAAGLACHNDTGAHDVMRGEETQIFGAATGEEPALIALPGTHGKWASVEGGRIKAFRTFMTGEAFALFRDHSTLTRAGDGQPVSAEDEATGFDDGVERARDGALLATLFETRSAQLRAGRSAGWALGFLSGLLIGHEVAAMVSAAQAAGSVSLIGDGALARRYARALAAHGVTSGALDGDACVLAGLGRLGDGW